MSIEVVNGYVCHSCSDAALAQKGVNPAHPTDDPSNPAYNAKTAKADKAKDSGVVTPAVVFGGALAGLNQSPSTANPSGSVAPVSGASSAASTGQGSTSSATPSPNPPSSAPAYANGTGSTPATGSAYSPGNLLNVSA